MYALNTNVSSKVVHISTRQLPASAFSSSSKSSFMVALQNPIACNDVTEHIALSLSSCSVPMSWYNVGATENQLSFNDGFLGIFQMVTIPAGNYTMKSLANLLAAELTRLTQCNAQYDVIYSAITGKIAITCSAPLEVVHLNLDVPNSAHRAMDFERAAYTFSGSILSPNICSLYDKYSIYVRCDLDSTNAYDSQGNLCNILQKVPIRTANSILYYEENAAGSKMLLSYRTVSAFTITLTFDSGELVDLGGLDWELSLRFDVVRDLKRGDVVNVREQLVDY